MFCVCLPQTGKISGAKKSRKRARKLTGRSLSAKMNEPYVDYSITKPCYGVSLYSKTDPKGKTYMKYLRQETTHVLQGSYSSSTCLILPRSPPFFFLSLGFSFHLLARGLVVVGGGGGGGVGKREEEPENADSV